MYLLQYYILILYMYSNTNFYINNYIVCINIYYYCVNSLTIVIVGYTKNTFEFCIYKIKNESARIRTWNLLQTRALSVASHTHIWVQLTYIKI